MTHPALPSSSSPASASAFARGLLATAALVSLTACVAPPVATPATPFEQDVVQATDQLTNQWRAQQLMPAFLARLAPTTLTVGPFVNLPAGSPQAITSNTASAPKTTFALPESIAAARAKQIVAGHLDAAVPEIKRVPADQAQKNPSTLLLSASLTPESAAAGGAKAAPKSTVTQLLTLVLLDSQTRTVVARWQGPVRTPVDDTLPTKFSADNPVIYKRSEASDSLFNTAEKGRLTSDAVAAGNTLGLLNMAQDAYGAGEYEKSLMMFQIVASEPSPYTIRAYNGQYLNYIKLGQENAAKQAFKQVISEGFKSQALAVKLLFTPGQTTFWADPAVSGAYDFWLKEISSQANQSTACMEIAGHTSRTGEEDFNLRLSLARGQRVVELMQNNQPALAPRLNATGKGWTENIVGSGTDDAQDAIDRRVEFKIAPCTTSATSPKAG